MKNNAYSNISLLNSINHKSDIDQTNTIKEYNSKMQKRKRNKFLISLYLNQKKLNDSNKKDNSNQTLKLNSLNNINKTNNLSTFRKTRNKTMRNIFGSESNSRIFENILSNNKQTKVGNKNNKYNKNNFLLLTSLYKLPQIKKNIKKSNKLYLNSHLENSAKNIHPTHLNDSTINNNNIFNESLISSNNKSNFNYQNFIYNNSKSLRAKNKIMQKKKLLSTLNSLLKNKYYEDTEKTLKDKITTKSFPSDYSLRDKVIHMKKVGVFWNSVLKYCVPIIYVDRYKAQRDFYEREKIKYFKPVKNKSGYFNENLEKKNISYGKRMEKSSSLLKYI